jgi:hypothetical protein
VFSCSLLQGNDPPDGDGSGLPLDDPDLSKLAVRLLIELVLDGAGRGRPSGTGELDDIRTDVRPELTRGQNPLLVSANNGQVLVINAD